MGHVIDIEMDFVFSPLTEFYAWGHKELLQIGHLEVELSTGKHFFQVEYISAMTSETTKNIESVA